MNATARRLDRLDTALPLAPALEALCGCVARAAGIPVEELRAEALELARRYAGMTTEETIAAAAAELDIPPAQLQADAERIEREAAVCLG